MAQPPLYQVKTGKDVVYAYSDHELEEVKGSSTARSLRSSGTRVSAR